MNILESTTLEYHETLNPAIWEHDNTIIPAVRIALLNIADKWIEFAKIPQASINDVILTGGNCNFNYTSASDLDVHIIVNYSKVSNDPEFLRDYYFSKKALWADKYPRVNVHGYPVELFAQDISEKPHANQGVFSLKENKWIQDPVYLGLDLANDMGVEVSSAELAGRINQTVDNDRGVIVAESLLNSIYALRQTGIAEGGEFAKGTLIFKDLRNRGLLTKLKEYISDKETRDLSLDKQP